MSRLNVSTFPVTQIGYDAMYRPRCLCTNKNVDYVLRPVNLNLTQTTFHGQYQAQFQNICLFPMFRHDSGSRFNSSIEQIVRASCDATLRGDLERF